MFFKVSALRKRYNGIIIRMKSRDTERKNLQKEIHELRHRQSELTAKLDHFQLSIFIVLTSIFNPLLSIFSHQKERRSYWHI